MATSSSAAATADGRRPGRRSTTIRVVVGLALLLFVWLAVAVWLLLGARSDLAAAQSTLPAARDALVEGDVEAAATAVLDADDRMRSARNGLRNPLVVPLRLTPLVGTDLRTLAVVADAAADVTAAAADTIAAIDDLPDGLASLAPAGGALPVDAIASLAGPLRATADASTAAVERIGDTTPSGRVAQVTDGRDRILEVLEPLTPQAETGALMAEHLPGFLGADGPRTYLIGASTPAEARNTGGFIGSVALVTFDDGTPSFGEFVATNDLPVLPPDELEPPSSDDDPLWRRYGGTGSWVNLNRTPDLPTAAVGLQRLWEATGGEPIDGMIVVDPFALSGLLELAGPVDVPGLTTLDADTVVDYVANEAYADFDDEDERKAVLGAVAAASLEGLLSGPDGSLDPQATVSVFADLVAAGHLRVHADDPEIQAAFARTPAAGALAASEGDLVSVTTYSGTASKVDFYAERRVAHEVTLLADGATRSEMTVTITNEAPTAELPSYVIGPNAPGLDAGDNLLDVSVHLAPDARFTDVPAATDAGPTFLEAELGHPVHRGWTRLASGEADERRYAWTTADAWEVVDDALAYELVFQGQTTIRPTELTLTVRVPDGFEVHDLPAGAEQRGETIVWEGEVRGETVRLPLRLGRAEA